MRKRAASESDDATPPRARRPADTGMSFVEVLVSIVLLGTVVIGVLTATRATIIGSALDRDHANAHAWLQSATDLIYGTARLDCGRPAGDIDGNGTDDDDNTERAIVKANLLAGYRSIAQSVDNPENWAATNIDIVDIKYWDGVTYQDVCYDDSAINLQLISLRVTAPDGRIVEEVEVIKGA